MAKQKGCNSADYKNRKRNWKHRLKPITLTGFRDALRPIASDKFDMVLFNPEDNSYVCNKQALYHQGVALSKEELTVLVSDPIVNKPLREPVLAIGIWSFLYDNYDLRNAVEFETTVNQISSYLGVSVGSKGFRLVGKLEAFRHVYGFIRDGRVVPLLEIKQQGDKLILRSEYLHITLNEILREGENHHGERRRFYSDKAFTSLVSAKNKTAALIVIELITLIVTASVKVRRPRISLRTLAERIPQLEIILFGNEARSVRNKKLRRAFKGVLPLIEEKTSLMKDYESFRVIIPELDVANPDAVIVIRHKGLKDKRRGEDE